MRYAATLLLLAFFVSPATGQKASPTPPIGADPSAVTGAEAQPNSKQVQTSPVQPSDKPKVFGVKPVDVDIRWTAYYVTLVEKTTPGKGHPIDFVDRQGI